ncbi:tetratricopeptide repeat protein [Zobellia barbeyronii]|uniref:Tetratricopeptide repeat protein n=1 Tax=Zobellia barbeyronii TaxID=2748009 RepID=A0ABS5WJM2_9FLAO|nr:tetratricopeptide repeat protein [Zobellia barbeyronii]MBT2163596.1 tetratricopeptide repeat protein [Zobellia barbeyronii]
MKKFFKYIAVFIGLLLLFSAIGATIWWNSKSDRKKSDLFVDFMDYESAIEYDPTNSNAWMERSVHFNKSGDFQQGFEYLDKAVELNPELHLGYRGWIRLRKLRDFDKALADFEQLDNMTQNVVDAPWGEDIDFLRGECYFGNKEYDEAIEYFNRSIKNQKEDWADVQTFVYLGICEFKMDNFEKAILEFKRALAQSENVCEAHFGMAKAYDKIGEVKLAKVHILKAEGNITYKRDDFYNEYLNEIYLSEILDFKNYLEK